MYSLGKLNEYSLFSAREVQLIQLRDAQERLWRAWRYLRRSAGNDAAMDELMLACVRIVNDIHEL